NAHPPAYFQELNDEIMAAISAASGTGTTDTPGGVHVRRRTLLSAESLRMLEATAAGLVACDGRSLAQRLDVAPRAERPPRAPAPAAALTLDATGRPGLDGDRPRASHAQRRRTGSEATRGAQPIPPSDDAGLLFDNGIGGMTADGVYVVRVQGDDLPPAPW